MPSIHNLSLIGDDIWNFWETDMRKIAMVGLGVLGLGLAACGENASNDDATQQALTALQDRAAIEDLIADYYTHLGTSEFGNNEKNFTEFFTPDAQLDINGIILNGYEEINGIYNRVGGEEPAPVGPLNTHVDYMQFDNLSIDIDGDTAVAKMFWTGIVSDDLNAPPQFQEMGREYDTLVKQDGKWLINRRVIIADAGMPVSMNDAYQRNRHFDITAD